MLLLKLDFWCSRRFLVNIFVKYRDYKVRQRQTTNYDRFWIRKCNKNFKNWITKCNGVTKCDKFGLQIAMELQSTTDYKVMQYNINTKAARISTLSSGKIDKYEYARVEKILLSNWSQIIQQAKFPLRKSLESKQRNKLML